MRERILYQPYEGTEPYIFLRYDIADNQAASRIVNNLMDKQFRICYDEYDNNAIPDSDWIADRMISSELTIFLISADAQKSLEFRNCINFALSKNKKIFCVYLDDVKLEDGLDMQLANIPNAKLSSYKDENTLCDYIIKLNCFSQNIRGQDVKIMIKSNRKKKVAVSILASIFALFIVATVIITVYRINYENSFAGKIEKMTDIDYLDISNENTTSIELLKDKTINTLIASNMDLTDIEALKYVNCKELDISENSKINTLEPLLDNPNLETVKVTQDMYPAIIRISGRHQFRLVITD
ncbi:MAG: toll/interleukin-1 receptor domain-containing protein [Clostridiales bacterium]|nr:toll/interleukin-1 receptor domain-containing protein [Clostridiales bacterium]